MKKDKKIIIVLLIFFFSYCIYLFFYLGGYNFQKEKNNITTIILDKNIVWNKEKGNWLNILDKEPYNWKKYNIYVNNEKLGNYYLVYNNKWYIFDNKKNSINYNGSLLAYSSNDEIIIRDFKVESIINDEIANTVLSQNNIKINQEFTVQDKIKIDIDQNGEEDTIYLISNHLPLSANENKRFNLVFIIKNNKLYYLYKDIDKTINSHSCKPSINSILNTTPSKESEIILTCSKMSDIKNKTYLFKYNKKKDEYKEIISN